jgi:hypothetical protein
VRAVRILYLPVMTLVACGPNNRDGNQPDASSPDAPASHDGSNSESSSKVYAHSGSTLFRIDTQNLGTVQIGAMTGLGTQSLTDLAIDKDDHMVGVTLDKLYSIEPTTGAVTLIKDLSSTTHNPTSLSFVPADLNDPASADILVTADGAGDVYQIDPVTGAATKLGSYGTVTQGKVVSSGDLIGVRGLGIYATVDINPSGTPDPNANDYLARIDPTTWTATPIGTTGTGFNNIFGLGFWAGKIYGFVDDKTTHVGRIIEIDPNTGAGHEILSGAQEWYGAGVTTDAPIIQ